MDTITHGIAGALIGKAAFGGDEMLAQRPMNARRIVTWSLMIGATFPDIDTLRDFFSRNDMLMITWHRSITHSLVCLPIFAPLLAALTRALCRWRKWDVPSFAALTGVYAVGILSHIFLDLVTTFGTMIWSPLGWSRPAWDIIFIIDFAFSAILLLPQMLAWVYASKEKRRTRSLGLWLVSEFTFLAVADLARIVGAPISPQNIAILGLLLAVLVFLPAWRSWGTRISLANWNRAGLFAACTYLALAALAHHAALERVKSFAELLQLNAQAIGALPLPPSLWHWDGLVRTPRGTYEMRMDLSDKSPIPAPANSQTTSTNAAAEAPPINYSYSPEAISNTYIDKARTLPEVQKVLWFDRFPVTRFHKEGDEAIVEILDKRFPQIRPGGPAPFTYRVRFDAAGNVISQGWEKD
jgi:membrane-bound metal-dependent hydrolase YbcI (DUF457 family)